MASYKEGLVETSQLKPTQSQHSFVVCALKRLSLSSFLLREPRILPPSSSATATLILESWKLAGERNPEANWSEQYDCCCFIVVSGYSES